MKSCLTHRPVVLAIALAILCPASTSAAPFQAESPPQSQPTTVAPSRDAAPGDFDLDAFIASLNPPTVEEIIASLEPIPTLEECLAPLPDDLTAPWKRVLTGEDKQRVEELEKRIQQLFEQRKYADAVPLAESAHGIRRRAQGVDHWQTTDARWLVKTLEHITSLSPESQAEFSKASEMMSRSQGLRQQGKYDDAKTLREQALAIYRQLLGNEHPKVAESLNDLAVALAYLGDYSAAGGLLREALVIRQELLGDRHPRVSESLSALGVVLGRQGNYASAEQMLRKALRLECDTLGNEHPVVAHRLNNLASLLLYTGDYARAEPLFRDALAIRRKVAANESVDIANNLNDLACLLRDKGDYGRAEPLYREALALRRKLFGNEHPLIAETLGNLAILLHAKGDYAAAELGFRQAEAMFRKLLGDEHEHVATTLVRLAALLRDEGDYLAAEAHYNDALEMYRKRLGDKHSYVATTLCSLASLVQCRSDYTMAKRFYDEAVATYREAFGDNHPYVATTLDSLAGLHEDQGDFARAERFYREALAMRRNLLGDEHPDVAVSLGKLGRLLSAKGDYSAAEAMWASAADSFEAARLRVSTVGLERAPFAARSSPLRHLAACLARNGKPWAAWERLEASLARGLLDTLSARHARPLDPEERKREESLLGQLAKLDERLAALLKKGASDETRALAQKLRNERDELLAEFSRFEADVTAKYGVVAGEVYDLARIQDPLPPDAALLAWVDIKGYPKAVDPNGEHWACLVRCEGEPVWVKLPGMGEDGAWTEQDEALPKRAGELLGQVISERLHPALAAPELPEGLCKRTGVSVTGRILQTRKCLDAADRDLLLALSDSPHWSNAVSALYERSQTLGDATQAGEICRRLAAQRIEPLRPHLEGVRHLIVLPAGWMAGVPIEALTDQYTVSYAPSGTMYAWLKEKGAQARGRERGRSLLALGDPVFARPEEPIKPTPEPPEHGVYLAMVAPESNAYRSGLEAGDVLLMYNDQKLSSPAELGPAIRAAAESQATRGEAGIPMTVWRDGQTLALTVAPGKLGVRPSQQPAAEAIHAKEHIDAVLRSTRGESLAPLPGTRREVETIAKLFERATPLAEAVVLLGPDASEQKLDELATTGELRKFPYVHLATHGVMDDQVAMRSALILSQDQLGDQFERAVAGQEVYDGRLTAEQIVRTWKLDAELVTLSGCQTALGKASGGEGFLGFSQALFVAGARSLVLSLWKVDDTATALLMTRFYENLLGRFDQPRELPGHLYPAGKAMPKAEALREAKHWLRGLSAEQVGTLCETYGLRVPSMLARGEAGPMRVTEPPEHPFEHPYYWSAFILIGDPD